MGTKVSEHGFKKKTIDTIIRKKMNSWLKTIEDETLRNDVQKNIIVTGGAITSMLQGEMPNDYDVYLKDADVCERLVNKYVGDIDISNKKTNLVVINHGTRVEIKIKSAGVIAGEDDKLEEYDYFESREEGSAEVYFTKKLSKKEKEKNLYKMVMTTSNAISLDGDIQIITRFIGEPEEIHKNYDFVHCTNYFTFDEGVVYNQNALESIMTKELRYVGSLYPLCSMFRLRKFISRGWSITAGEMMKIAWDISNLELDNIEVLQDQMTGVDSAYFHEVINILKKNNTRNIDRTFLFELLNRVFDGSDDIGISETDIVEMVEE